MIKIENLTVIYDKIVLDNVNMHFPSNGVFCIYAPSGTGKTTLLNAIAGLVKYSGQIKVNGRISYLFQEDRLLNWLTARQNVMLLEPVSDVAQKYMEAFGIHEFESEMPQNLSGGMKRRVALARTLAYDADIYLLDEPFKGLDEDNVKKVQNEINSLAQNKLVLVVTHDPQDAVELNAQKVLL